jgi:hypothetical protein
MCRLPVLVGAALLTVSSFAQEPETSQNPNCYTQNTYNRPSEVMPPYGDLGLLGLLGLTGLFGLSRVWRQGPLVRSRAWKKLVRSRAWKKEVR